SPQSAAFRHCASCLIPPPSPRQAAPLPDPVPKCLFLCPEYYSLDRPKPQGKTGGKMKSGATFGSLFLMALVAPAWAGTIKTDVYGTTKEGATVHVFTMTNNHGMRAQVLDLGGVVCDVEVPGRDGKMANVILCQRNLAGIEASGPMSALTGRYANRL